MEPGGIVVIFQSPEDRKCKNAGILGSFTGCHSCVEGLN